jgi:hypothetical protein
LISAPDEDQGEHGQPEQEGQRDLVKPAQGYGRLSPADNYRFYDEMGS